MQQPILILLSGVLCLINPVLSSAEPATKAQPTPIDKPLTVGRHYPTPPPKPTSPNDVMAIVNGTKITRLMLNTYHKKQPKMKTAEAIDELVTQELLRQAARHAKLDQIPEAQAEIDNQVRFILAGAAIQSELNKHPITQQMLQAEYDKQKHTLTQKEYKARHIISKTKANALKIVKQLNAGADFQTLAKKHSIGSSKIKGGDIGWFSPNQMAKPFSDAIAALTPNEYTKTPIKTRFGWHTVLLEKTREIPPPRLDQIKNKITRAIQTRIVNAYLQTLKQQAKIEITKN